MATTSDRNTPHEGSPKVRKLLCGAGTYLKGVPVMIGEDDELVKPLTGSTNLKAHVVGVSDEHKTVSTHGTEELTFRTEEVFFFLNTAGANEVKNGDAGKLVYFTDNETVSLADSGDDVIGARADHIDLQVSGSAGKSPVGVFLSLRGPRSGSTV